MWFYSGRFWDSCSRQRINQDGDTQQLCRPSYMSTCRIFIRINCLELVERRKSCVFDFHGYIFFLISGMTFGLRKKWLEKVCGKGYGTPLSRHPQQEWRLHCLCSGTISAQLSELQFVQRSYRRSPTRACCGLMCVTFVGEEWGKLKNFTAIINDDCVLLVKSIALTTSVVAICA